MKKVLQKAGVLFLIFIRALVVYFIGTRSVVEKESAVYTSMREPSLPVVYAQLGGQEVNCLHGYMQDIGNQAARKSISILPEDRGLHTRIQKYGNIVTGISYEVRNLTMNRLVERTEAEDWDSRGGGVSTMLPIQDLLARNETYLLSITVPMGGKGLHYYTRIMWPGNICVSDMVGLAGRFTRKSLDYNWARDLVPYPETNDTKDNSSLGHVTIRANFSHLTWDGLDVKMVEGPRVALQEFDDIMSQIQIRYQVTINEEDGTHSLADAVDNFTTKWNEQRIYLMNYERNANKVFDGGHQSFSGKKVLLRITNDDKVRIMKGPKSKYVAFKTGGDLWCYDYDDKQVVCVFSFRSNSDDGVGSDYDRHDIKILSIQGDGAMDLLVCGYMNRGKYEGRMGVVFYHYDREQSTVQEKFFLPASESYDTVKTDIDKLSYPNENDMMYIMFQGTVYGIDLKNNKSPVVAQGLTEGSYAVSGDTNRFAWQEGQNLYESEKIHVMNFSTSQKQEIIGEINNYVRVLGFVGNDLMYGLGSSKDKWIVNGCMKDIPMYAIYIVDTQMRVESEYRKNGICITDVVAQDGRVHLKRLVPLGESQYLYQNEGTIVCNQEMKRDPLEGIDWFAPQDKGKVHFVQLGSEINRDKVRTSAPEVFSYEYTSVLDTGSVTSSSSDNSMVFKAYGGGHYIGSSRSFSQAVEMTYGRTGYVTDSNQHIVWDRVNRQPIRNIKSPVDEARKVTKYLDSFDDSRVYEDKLILTGTGGCSLIQILYYVDKGIPVIAYVESGQYVLLSGYDQYNVTLYDPQTQGTQKMRLNDAAEHFKNLQNNFLYALAVE